jgi:hypothetical protein
LDGKAAEDDRAAGPAKSDALGKVEARLAKHRAR